MNKNLNRMVGTAILIAIVVVLQMLGSFIKIGTFSISLVLVPIAVGAAMYGALSGAALGTAFGVVVLINCVNGTDVGGNMLWVANPVLTAVLCIFKGAAAGFLAGLIYKLIEKSNKFAAAVGAAVVCPIVNTGIFLAAMVLFFHETLLIWANGSELVYYTLITLAGANFALELGVNIVLSPVIVRIVNAVSRKRI